MSGFHPFFDLVDPLPPVFSYLDSSISAFASPFTPPPALVEQVHLLRRSHSHSHLYLDHALDLLSPAPFPSFDILHQCLLPSHAIASLDLLAATAADPFELDRSAAASFRKLRERTETELCLRDLSDRVAALELGLGFCGARSLDLDRKYQWTAEISGPKGLGLDLKYKWTAAAKADGERLLKCTTEIKGPEEEEGFDRKFLWSAEAKGVGERNLTWAAEFKGKGKHSPLSRTYTWATSTKPPVEEEEKKRGKKKKQEKKGKECTIHEIEIEQKIPVAIANRKVFTRRCDKGKKKELSAIDAAVLIQMAFRTHLARRSQVLRCLRELAMVKARLKDLRDNFTNFSYRRRLANDPEERQRFSEKIIVLILTIEQIQGPDYMVRAAKKLMVKELEAMLDAVDPQPLGKLRSMKRRKFDLPDGPLSKEMMEGVAKVVQEFDQE